MAKKTPELGPETGVLLLHGKETYLQSAYVETLVDRVQASGVETDVLRFDGRTAVLAEVLDECRSMGLMMQHKIVVVDDADQFVKVDDRRRVLERYAENPAEGSTLVLRATNWHPGKLDKVIPKRGAVIKCAEITPARAKKWCVDRSKARHAIVLEPDAVELLVGKVGCELSRLASEIDKLAIGAAEGGSITREDVKLLVGASKEEKAWAIQDAVLTGDPETALAKVRELLEMPKADPLVVRVALAFLAQKLYGFASAKESGVRPSNIWPVDPGRASAIHASLGLDGLARLLSDAVEADRRAKSGMGHDIRSLERLTLRFARALSV